jgi:mannitol/fructose-specific phosphotransferase system IIA component (Ntr-type)
MSKKDDKRYNLPLELGIDLGLKESDEWKCKKLLIMEKDDHTYLKVISDLRGFDLKIHKNDRHKITNHIVDWLDKPSTHDVVVSDVYDGFYENYKSELSEKMSDEKVREKLSPTKNYRDIMRIMKKYIEGISLQETL